MVTPSPLQSTEQTKKSFVTILETDSRLVAILSTMLRCASTSKTLAFESVTGFESSASNTLECLAALEEYIEFMTSRHKYRMEEARYAATKLWKLLDSHPVNVVAGRVADINRRKD